MARSKKILEGTLKELKRRYSAGPASDLDRRLASRRSARCRASRRPSRRRHVRRRPVARHRPARFPAAHARAATARRVLAEGAGARGDLPRRRPDAGHRRTARSNEARMNWKKIFAVIRREYVERIRTKAFWIATLLIPILFLGYIASRSRSRGRPAASAARRRGQTGRLYAAAVKELAAHRGQAEDEPRPDRGARTGSSTGVPSGRPRRRRRRSFARRSSPRRSTATCPRPRQAREGRGRVLLDDRLRLHRDEPAPARDQPHPAAPEDRRARPAGGPREELEKRIDLKPFKVTREGHGRGEGRRASSRPSSSSS